MCSLPSPALIPTRVSHWPKKVDEPRAASSPILPQGGHESVQIWQERDQEYIPPKSGQISQDETARRLEWRQVRLQRETNEHENETNKRLVDM